MKKQIGQYTIQEIGESKGKKFYKAICNIDNRQYSATEISIRSFRSDISKISNEIEILKHIQQNPHIVSFFDTIKTSSCYYFFYQYCNGGDLSELIQKQGKIQQLKALQISKQLLEAFKIISTEKQLMLDIKPQNIYLHDEVVKVGGFKFCKDLGRKGTIFVYKPPQAFSLKMISQQYDLVWTLGITLYEMIFGFCPFSTTQIAKLMDIEDQSHLNFSQSISISEETKQFIRKMLNKDINQRIRWKQLEQTLASIMQKIESEKHQKAQSIKIDKENKQQPKSYMDQMNFFFFRGGDAQINNQQRLDKNKQKPIQQQQISNIYNIENQLIKAQTVQENFRQQPYILPQLPSVQIIPNQNNQHKQLQTDPIPTNKQIPKQTQKITKHIPKKIKIRQRVKVIIEENQIKPKRPENIVIVKNQMMKPKRIKGNEENVVLVNLHHDQKLVSTHSGFMCDICQRNPIVGIRYHCQTCVNFDICHQCYETVGHEHELSQHVTSKIYSHIFQTIAKLVQKPRKKNKFELFKPNSQQQIKV